MQTKGFTLIEMLITLSVLSIFMLILPMIHPNERIALRYEILTLKERLLKAQSDSIAHKKENNVDFLGNQYTIGDQTYTMNALVHCYASSFHYTPQGTISNALTINCNCSTQTRKLVLQLGTGRIHAK